MSSRTRVLPIAISGVVSSALAVWIVACGSSSNTTPPPAGEGGADAASESAADLTPEEQFRAFQVELIATCGGTNGVCHVLGTFENAPLWLGNPDPYISAKNYMGILPASGDPSDSILLTQAQHEGPSLIATPDLFGKVRAWIAAEVGSQKLPETDPAPVNDGLNTIDLSSAAMGIMGAKLTFLATTNNDILTLSSMKLYSPTTSGLHIDSPFFVIVPSSGPVIADPTVNGFSGPLDVPAASSVDFYSGQIILLKWSSTSQIRIAFKAIAATAGGADAGPSGDCTALSTFTSMASPAFQSMTITNTDGGTKTSCFFCHSGGDDVAMNAMDLSALGTDDAHACAQARNFIDFANKAQSQLITNPQGMGDPNHPIQSLQATDPIIMGITAWVNAETQ